MKNTGKRLISSLLCLMMVLSMMLSVGNAAPAYVTVYFNAIGSGWTNVNVYAWGNGGVATDQWPGSAMTDLGDGIFVYKLPVEARSLIFNNGSGDQTCDLSVPTDGKNQYNYATSRWTEYSGIDPEPDTPPEIDLSGTQVSGTIDSGKDTAGTVSVELWVEGVDKAAYAITTASDTYTIENVVAGTYTMVVRKANHVTRSYLITVETEEVLQDLRICQLGDATCDGQINMGDVPRVYSHVRGTSLLTEEYALVCADINGGGLDVGDVSAIYSHVRGSKPITPSNPSEPEEEEKTIHDFEGFEVVNLDDQENTNFLVYAKGVQQLTTTSSSNILLSADRETGTYVFEKPDNAMRSLKPGDVFFIGGTSQNPEGVTVKVQSLSVSGETATIHSSPAGMEDLFEYVDIDMDVPVTELLYDPSQLTDGVELYIGEPGSGARSTHNGDLSYSRDAKPIVYEISLAEIEGKGQVSILGGTASGSMDVDGSLKFTIENIHLDMEYCPHDRYFSYDLTSDVCYGLFTQTKMDGSWKLGKDGAGIPWVTPRLRIGTTPLYVQCGITSRLELSGKLEGEANFYHLYHAGVHYNTDSGLSGEFNKDEDTKSGKGSLEGSVLLAVDGKLSLGVPVLLEGFVDATVGVEFTGKMDLWDYDAVPEDNPDCIHNCEKCIDGDVNLVYGCGVGVRSDLVDWILDDEKQLRLDIVPETRKKLTDFYCSFDENDGVEFGWGPCPKKGWRTELTVTEEHADGSQVAYSGVIKFDFEDNRHRVLYTDQNGYVIDYFPEGNYDITFVHAGVEHQKKITIAGGPIDTDYLIEMPKVQYTLSWSESAAEQDSTLKAIEDNLSSRYPGGNKIYSRGAIRIGFLVDTGYFGATVEYKMPNGQWYCYEIYMAVLYGHVIDDENREFSLVQRIYNAKTNSVIFEEVIDTAILPHDHENNSYLLYFAPRYDTEMHRTLSNVYRYVDAMLQEDYGNLP